MADSGPFYRTPLIRFALIAAGVPLTWAFSPWGPDQWRDTPSLHWLHTVLPWSFLSLLFAGYVVLLSTGNVVAVAVAEVAGAVVFGWELVALVVTLHPARPTNPLAVAAVFLTCVFHIAAARLAIIQAARRVR